MTTKFVKFSPENKAAADDYSDFLDSGLNGIYPFLVPWANKYEETFSPDFQAGYLWRDTNLNWVVAWFGPPFKLSNVEVSPLSGDDAARALGVLVDTPDWYDLDSL